MVTPESPKSKSTMIREYPTSDIAAASASSNLHGRFACGYVEPEGSKFFKKQPPTFPSKLMQILSMEEYSDIIMWLPHGCSFAIINPKEFISVVLPRHFTKVKYSSFTRKLHRWGFKRVSRGEEAGSYYHKLFQRDNNELCKKMSTRQHKKDSKLSEKFPRVCGPVLVGLTRKNERNDCQSFQINVNKGSMAQLYSSQGFEWPFAEKQDLLGFTIPELINHISLPTLQAQSLVIPESNKYDGISRDKNRVDQLMISQRLQARSRAAAMSRNALMMMQTPTLVLGMPGACQQNSDGALNYLDQKHQRRRGAVEITSIALKQDSELGIAAGGNIQSILKNIQSERRRQIGTLTRSFMLPPSA